MVMQEILIREFVEKYNKWLLDEGFCDTDIIYEFEQCEPEYNSLINDFLIKWMEDNKHLI